jgi:hypothetical protein
MHRGSKRPIQFARSLEQLHKGLYRPSAKNLRTRRSTAFHDQVRGISLYQSCCHKDNFPPLILCLLVTLIYPVFLCRVSYFSFLCLLVYTILTIRCAAEEGQRKATVTAVTNAGTSSTLYTTPKSQR